MPTIFALGSNGSGQLGIGHKEDVSVPKPVSFPPGLLASSSIQQIAAGGNHTLIVISTGELFWSGDATSGACGSLSASSQQAAAASAEFRKVSLDVGGEALRVALVAATWEASVVVALDGEGRQRLVYSFGLGMRGELGQGPLIVRTPAPGLIADFPPDGLEVVDLAACAGHVVVVLSNGEAYGWGNGRKGQLGEPAEAAIHSPRKIEGVDFEAKRAVCGREFTCLVGDLDKGQVLVLGSHKWGVKASVPSSTDEWIDIGASWGNVHALKRNGAVISWGRDDHGQMAPPNLPSITQVAVGSEHVLALDEAGSVLAWGWGEHGNCGPQVVNGDVKGRWNVIASPKYLPPGSKITNIGAGCSTSWIIVDIPS